MGSSPLDVLIVGAGPAGAATAWHLARAGLAVQLVDRARFPRDKPCSEYLSPEAVRQLDRLGVLARVEREGAPILGTTVVGPRGATLTGRFAGAAVPPWRDTGLAIARRVLDHALVEAAAGAGARLQEGLAVEALLHEAGGVAGAVLRDAAGRRAAVRARLVIGADGLRSVVARRLGGSAPAGLGGLARIAFVAHVAGVPGLEGLTEMHVGDDGYVGLNRLTRDGVANVALVVPARRAAAARGDAPGSSSGSWRATPASAAGWTPPASRAGCWSPAPSPRGRAGWWPTAPCWWATPRTSSTPSPARASAARSAAPSSRPPPRWRRWPTPARSPATPSPRTCGPAARRSSAGGPSSAWWGTGCWRPASSTAWWTGSTAAAWPTPSSA
ncbi:MAG: FAD-dependent oxidoreductase [Gemmatimonadetes bacterium]|nr:FAD-dependent oxidoreductase [Gemmatimonadota bacterium]